MAIEYNFTLDMDRSKRDNNVAYARTGDMDSIVINANLVFGGAAYTPSGENAFFECITPNGRSIRSAAEKTGSSVTVEVPPAAFQAAGVINVAYFRFESGETGNPTYVESTEPFAIVVREGIGDSIDAGDYIEDWRKLVDHLEVVVADVGQKAEQVEIAKAAAEKAKADAETAGTAAANSAESAASSALAAKSSATAAQQSAASVADKYITSAEATTLEPGSQATASVADQVLTIGVPKGDKGDKGDTGDKGDPGVGVPEGGTPGQLLSKTEDSTAWVDPPSTGNVLTGTATGYVAHAEDAYAAKPREVRIEGRTVMKNLWVNPSGTSNGITVTANEDGSITISGTSTANFYIYSTIYSLKPGSTYTLSIDKTVNVNISIQPYDNSDVFIINIASIGSNGASKNTGVFPSNAAYARLKIQCPPGTAISGTYRIMLNEGSEPEPWCPHGLYSVQTGNLVTSGKNLLPKLTLSVPSSAGVTATIDDNNLITLNGTATNQSTFALLGKWPYTDVLGEFVPGTYTLSVGSNAAGISFDIMDLRERRSIFSVSARYQSKFTKTLSEIVEYTYIRIQIDTDTTLNNVTLYPQLELGSTATAYEPPNVTTTLLPEVELRSLSDGTCDELVIKSDGTCEVERRTQLSGSEVTALPEPTTEPQSPVTLPTLPAPTFNAWHDSDIPSDTSVEYARDINIVIDNLAKQIAGTAVTVAINEATR